MSDRVQGAILLDDPNGRDISDLLNAAADVGCPPLLLAALGVAESSQPGKPRGLYERTIGDAHTQTGSHGLFQINPQYHPGHPAAWYRVAENAIDYAAPIMADNLLAAGGDWVRAMGLWNKPNGTASPGVLGNYAAGLEFARAHYAATEEPVPDTEYAIGQGVKDAMRRYADTPKGDEVYLPDGTTSITPGEGRLYFYSKASNQVYVAPKA